MRRRGFADLRVRGIPPAAVCLLSLTVCACATAYQHGDLVIADADIVDGTSSPRQGSLLIRDGRVAAVVDHGNFGAPDSATIDGSGRFVMPGLWDSHVHLRATAGKGLDPYSFLVHGVTSVRDVGGLRDGLAAVLTGDDRPPLDIVTTYEMLNGESFGPFQIAVHTDDEVRRAIRDVAARGAVQIKVHRALAPMLLPSVIAAAAAEGLDVVGHIPLGMHPLDACRAGMAGIEHIGSFIEAYVSVGAGADTTSGIEYLLSPAADELYDCLSTRKVYVTPTLVVYEAVARNRSGGNTIPEAFEVMLRQFGEITRRMHDRAVPLLAGTDTSDLGVLDIPPGVSLVAELVALHAAGIPAADVMRIAWCGMPSMRAGKVTCPVIRLGADADLVILAGNPNADIAALYAVEVVIADGEVVAGRATRPKTD